MENVEPTNFRKKYVTAEHCNICKKELLKDGKIRSFSVPKGEYENWKVIPQLQNTDRLCEIHYDGNDIIKGIQVKGDFYPSERWRLLKSAFPKHHLSIQFLNFASPLFLFPIGA